MIPSDKGFPGTATEVPSQAPGKRPVFFATGGESGRVKIWSSATAQCVYEHLGLGTTAGGNYTAVAMLPGHAGLMAATADCNLLFLQPKVLTVLPNVACSFCWLVLAHPQDISQNALQFYACITVSHTQLGLLYPHKRVKLGTHNELQSLTVLDSLYLWQAVCA